MFCLVRLDGQTKAGKMKICKIDRDRDFKKFFELLKASDKKFLKSEILQSFKISVIVWVADPVWLEARKKNYRNKEKIGSKEALELAPTC